MKRQSGRHKTFTYGAALLAFLCFMCICMPVFASSGKVKVAFFPMNGQKPLNMPRCPADIHMAVFSWRKTVS